MSTDINQTTKVDKHGFVLKRGDHNYVLDHPAQTEPDGSFLLSQMRNDEIMVLPGVIYRRVVQ